MKSTLNAMMSMISVEEMSCDHVHSDYTRDLKVTVQSTNHSNYVSRSNLYYFTGIVTQLHFFWQIVNKMDSCFEFTWKFIVSKLIIC